MGAVQLVVHVWELDPGTGRRATAHPTLTHVFWGKDRGEAEELAEAHAEHDDFLRGALEASEWNGIGLEWQGVWLENGKETPWHG